jgi:hypothetical protein
MTVNELRAKYADVFVLSVRLNGFPGLLAWPELSVLAEDRHLG